MPTFMRLTGVALALAFALILAACGGDDDNGNGNGNGAASPTEVIGDSSAGSDTLTIVAENNEFDKDELTAPANTQITVTLDNKDEGVLHNFAVYEDSSASEEIFKGELFQGPETRDYQFETPGPGEYYFRCDVHPDTMNGTFIVQ